MGYLYNHHHEPTHHLLGQASCLPKKTWQSQWGTIKNRGT